MPRLKLGTNLRNSLGCADVINELTPVGVGNVESL